MKHAGYAAFLAALGALSPVGAYAQNAPYPPAPATEATREANQAVLDALPFEDTSDFDNARRGFIDRPETLTIKDANGGIVWDLEQYKQFITPGSKAPDSVNPSLWRVAQLNLEYGLFEVTDGIYQVRGYDISNISFIRGETGWIVFDPLVSEETARAAYDLVTKNLGERPVVAVVYSHSHVDHYGGVRGVIDEADVEAGKVKVIAPEGFLEHAISENVIAGNAMSRRAIYMYGSLLPRNAQGGVGSGLGLTTSRGTVTLIPPTDVLSETGTELVIDGVRMVFQMTPGSEAPAEMNTWLPDFKALWMAENTTNTMHNILTLRGAQVRDPLIWSTYIQEAIDLYADKADVKFQSHHWPLWGREDILSYLEKQRDMYKFMHDRTVNLMNSGYNGAEIADMISLPQELENNWPTRGYYGTLRHNSRAIYQRYMGWYDGNPSNLNVLPPEQSAAKYVEYMGGSDAIMERAGGDFEAGNYRWVSEALKHVVFAEPDNQPAKLLLADALEQLGYQSEAGPWRSVYLQGAFELRNGIPDFATQGTASPDVIRAMPPEMLFDYLAVRLNGEKAAGADIGLNMEFTDLDETYGLTVRNGVLNHGPALGEPDATITLAKSTLDAVQLGETTLEDARASGDLEITGETERLAQFLGLLESFPFWFGLVTP